MTSTIGTPQPSGRISPEPAPRSSVIPSLPLCEPDRVVSATVPWNAGWWPVIPTLPMRREDIPTCRDGRPESAHP